MNVKNRTMFIKDNVAILDNINSSSVDLIYLDPPFNSNKNYSAPVGSKAAGASFKDAWTLDDIDLAWLEVIRDENKPLAALLDVIDKFGGKGDKSYLIFMARRLLEMHRILKDTGSIYLHCDPTMSHSLKLVMDCIFAKDNFRNEIVWSYQRWTGATKHFQRMHDNILFYAGSKKAKFNIIKEPYSPKSKHKGARLSVFTEGKLEQSYTDDESRQKSMRDVWEISYINSQAKERTGYPTQKPLALLERIIKASSNEGDVVLDPFCGCATALVAAEKLHRQWIGIDISDKAVDLIRTRLQAEETLWRQVKDGKHIIVRTDILARTDTRDKFVNPAKYKSTLYGICLGACAGCGTHFEARNMEVDHIVPKSKGGQDIKDNLQLLCGNCNKIKGDRDMPYLMAELKAKYDKNR